MKIYLGLGSNLGDRIWFLNFAVQELLEHSNISIKKKSRIYETPPLYNLQQGNFLNQVVEIETELPLPELLKIVKNIENAAGRKSSPKQNFPRQLDIDILASGNMIYDNIDLKVPHPKIFERRFVLKPWSEIAPDFMVASERATVIDLLNRTSDTSIISVFDNNSE